MKHLLTFVILGLFLVPMITSAFTLKTAPDVYLDNDYFIEDNLYILSGNLDFNKTIDEDVFIISGNSNIKGAIFGDLQTISVKNFLNGEVFGDARLIGGETIITGNTNKDLLVISAKVKTEKDSILNGKTLIVGGQVHLDGQVLDDLKIIAGNVYINAEILGDLEITSQNITVGDGADIKGEFLYFAPQRAEIKSGARISNRPVYNQIEAIKENSFIKTTVLNFISFWTVIKFLANLILAFILVFIFKVFAHRVSLLATKKLGISVLVGLLSLILIPVIIVILFASLFGIPIAVIILLIYLVLMILTPSVSGIILGYFMQKKFNKGKKLEINYNFTALGIIILTFLFFIPYLGSVLKLFFLVISMGAMVVYYYELIIKRKKTNE